MYYIHVYVRWAQRKSMDRIKYTVGYAAMTISYVCGLEDEYLNSDHGVYA